MKLLVFAHIPPPYHGQSAMTELMLDGLGRCAGDGRGDVSKIECYHVDCRISQEFRQIGRFGWRKVARMLRHIFAAIKIRLRCGEMIFYYVPARPARTALYRDWVILALCRPFFHGVVLHWHAVGLGEWLRAEGTSWERWLSRRLLGRPALSISVARSLAEDAHWTRSRQVAIVHNGIVDPFPDFTKVVLPRRQARFAARRKLIMAEQLTDSERAAAAENIEVFRVLFMTHVIREKGIFDTIEAVRILRQEWEQTGFPLRIHLTVAGGFPRRTMDCEVHARIIENELAAHVTLAGFVRGSAKEALLRECDCLCFPSYYSSESLPVAIIEAMAAGMNIIATRWRAIPELLSPDWPGLVPVQSPEQIAAKVWQFCTADYSEALRSRFLANFTAEHYTKSLGNALRGIVSQEC